MKIKILSAFLLFISIVFIIVYTIFSKEKYVSKIEYSKVEKEDIQNISKQGMATSNSINNISIVSSIEISNGLDNSLRVKIQKHGNDGINEVIISLMDSSEKKLCKCKKIQMEEIDICNFTDVKWPGMYEIIVSASDYITSRAKVSSITETVSVDLYPNPILNINVVNENGSPVSDAEIDIKSTSEGVYTTNVRTDSFGECNVGLPFIGTFSLDVSHPLFNTEIRDSIKVDSNPNSVRIVMVKIKGCIFGFVYDENHIPAKGQKLILNKEDRYQLGERITDENGRYEFNELPYDCYNIQIRSTTEYLVSDIIDTDAGRMDLLKVTVVISPDKTTERLDFNLTNAFKVGGIVKNKRGTPLKDAIVRASIKGPRERLFRPISDEVITNADGKFSLYLNRRVAEWNKMVIHAKHANYETGQSEYKEYMWDKNLENIEIVLDDPQIFISGKTLDSVTNLPLSVTMLLSRSKQLRTGSTITMHSDNDGVFQGFLPEGPYVISASGYEIVSPQRLHVMRDNETDTTVRLKKSIEADKKLVSGTVLSKDTGAPIQSVKIKIKKDGFSSQTDFTEKDGRFSISVPSSLVLELCELVVFHRDYQFQVIPLDEIDTNENFAIYLEEYKGTIKITLENVEESENFKVYLRSISGSLNRDISMKMDGYEGWIQRVNPEGGPYVVLASDGDYYGISKVFDLNSASSNYYHAIVPLAKSDLLQNFSFQVLNLNTKKPIGAVSCTLSGQTLGSFGQISEINKSTVSDEMGQVFFQDIPCFVGIIKFHHGIYEDYIIKINDPMRQEKNSVVFLKSLLEEQDK